MSCQIRNTTTGEPKPFYKANGQMFEDYADALNAVQDGESVSINFINTEDTTTVYTEQGFQQATNDFVKFGSQIRVSDDVVKTVGVIPVSFDPTTQVGITNQLIRDGLVESTITKQGDNYILNSKGATSFERVQNADDTWTELKANSASYGYTKKGETFVINPNFGKIRIGNAYMTEQELEQAVLNDELDFTDEPEMLIYRQLRLQQLTQSESKSLTLQPTTDTNESLVSNIMSFLSKIGFSLESIESYRQKYKAKHDIEPDAEALVDIANQVIAFKDGKITVEGLSEEAAHLIIEGWNQEEVGRLLRNVHKTQEWAQHAEAYRAVYSKIYPAEQVEDAVRREILGKFLSNQLKNPTPRTEVETNIFNYLINLISGFFNRVSQLTTQQDTDILYDFTRRVGVLLQNKELEGYINQDSLNNSRMSVMYAISEASPFYNIYRKASEGVGKVEQELRILQELSVTTAPTELSAERTRKMLDELTDSSDQAEILASISALFGIFDTKVRELQTILNTIEPDQGIRPSEDAVYHFLRDQLLPTLQSISASLTSNPIASAKTLFEQIQETFQRYNNVAGEIENRAYKDVDNNLLEEVERRSGEDAAKRVKEAIEAERADHSWFYKMFGQPILSKFPQLAKLGRLIFDMSKSTRLNFITEATPFFEILKPLAKQLPKLAKEGYYWSHRDRELIQKRRNTARATALKNVLGLSESIEELSKTNWTPQLVKDYISEHKIGGDAQTLLNKWRYEADKLSLEAEVQKSTNKFLLNRKRLFEIYEKLGISPDTYRVITTHKAAVAKTRRKMGENPDPNDPSNDSLLEALDNIKVSRNTVKSIYTPTGAIKKGLYLYTESPRSPYDPNNPNHVRYRRGLYLEIDRSEADTDAAISFELHKLDRYALDRKEQAELMLAQDPDADTSSTGWIKDFTGKWVDNGAIYELGDTSSLKSQLSDIWDNEYNKEITNGTPPQQAEYLANRRTFKWFQSLASVGFTQEYWEQLLSNTTLQDFVDQNIHRLPQSSRGVLNVMSQINRRRASIADILKRYQDSSDYREIRAENLTPLDRDSIVEHESIIRGLIKENVLEVFKEAGIEFNEESFELSERRPNRAFYRIFEDRYGIPYQNATAGEKLSYIGGLVPAEVSEKRTKLSKAIDRYIKYGKELGQAWSAVIDQMGFDEVSIETKDQIIEAYLIQRIPSYMQRFEPKGYTNILNQLESNMKQEVKGSSTLLDRLIEGQEPNFQVEISGLSQEQMGVKYAQSLDAYKAKFDQAQLETDRARRLLKSYESFLHIAGEDDGGFDRSTIDQSFLTHFGMTIDAQDNLSVPTQNLDEFEGLVALLRLRAMSLEKFESIYKNSVFQYAKLPKTKTDRIINGNPQGIKFMLQDILRYREDEEESFIRSEARRIPKIGFSNLPTEDTSTDLFRVAFLDLYNAEQYKNRTETLSSALALKDSVSKVKIKGKATKESEMWQMVNNVIDTNFYGRQVTWTGKINIGGQEVNIAKILKVFRKFVQFNALGLSLPVATTSLITAGTNKLIQRFVEYHLYSKASNRANMEFWKLSPDSIAEVGSIYATSKLERIMQLFGNYDITERLANTAFGFGIRNLSPTKVAFSVHQMANFPVIPRVVLSKLMEYRIVDGRFVSWSNYLTLSRAKDPSLTNSQIRESFDKQESHSIYDYLNLDNNATDKEFVFNISALKSSNLLKNLDGSSMTEQQIEQYMKETFNNVVADISYNISQYDGIIDETQKAEAQRHPILAFSTMFKSWLVVASSRYFSPELYNQQTGNWEQGVLSTISSSLNDIIENGKTKGYKQAAIEVFNSLEPSQIANLKSLGFSLSAIGVLAVMTATLLSLADGDGDDDDEDYMLELMAFISLRVLNETAASTIGLPSEYYSFLDSPVSSSTTIKTMADVFNITNMGEEVTRGQYEGWNKYSANLFKLTILKNLYGLSSAESIRDSRKGYEFFVRKEALFSVLALSRYIADSIEDEK